MPVVQSHEMNNLQDHDYTKVGNGIFLNPYSGGGINEYYRHKKHGDGFSDIINTGVNFFKNNSRLIADAASTVSGIANVIKTAKEIKRADEELYELKRIKDEVSRKKQEPPFTKSQLEIMDKIRKSGGGVKII